MLCKDFLLKNGGALWIESETGKGSIFSFTLPIVADPGI
jgi:two-component system, sensor histidine kinase and response regulator